MPDIKAREISEESLAGLSGLNPVFQRVLAARGIRSHTDIKYSLDKLLAPASIRHLETAAELLCQHISRENQILIFGDYDADGATSTALCIKSLNKMEHHRVDFLMPDRFVDGYGLSLSIAKRIAEINPDCVITVDNGIASFDGIELLRQQQIDVIVTDHHLPAEKLPNASVIVNQNAWPDVSEGRNLAGVGVAFYLMLAVRSRLRQMQWFSTNREEPNLAECLDLVAIGSVADLVPLDYLNRVLVHEGVRRIRAGACSTGIRSLIDVAGKQHEHFSTSDIAFALAPRINAAGRLDDMTVGVQCLLASDEDTAQGFANELNDINQLRKDIQQQMASEALQQLKEFDQQGLANRKVIVLYREDWHEGIVGIVASKLKEKYHCPCIVFGRSEDGSLKGSGRSIQGIHLRDMLDVVDKRIPGAILKFGGHAMAAGLSLDENSYEAFVGGFEAVIDEFADNNCFTVYIEHDGELDSEHFDLQFVNDLQNLSPWGQRFPAPSFVGEFEVVNRRVLAEKHLKLTLCYGKESFVDAIAFFQPASVLNRNYQSIRIHYELSVNRFRGNESVQLMIRDIL